MQCPVCHSDTSSSLGRCTRCNARLDDATVRDAAEPAPWPSQQPSGSSSPPQPGESLPGPLAAGGAPGGNPEPAPFGGIEPWRSDPWAAETANDSGPSRREESTSLSPEPWDGPQPQMWQPPPPRRRSKALPYVLTGLGVWILTVVALAIIFWPNGDDDPTGTLPQQTTTSVEQPGGGSPPETTEVTPTTDDAEGQRQATQIDALLSDMSSTRNELGAVVSAGCNGSDLQRIRDQRQEQLDTASTLQVDALPDGEALKNALTSALEISIESNDLYLDHAPGCPSDEAADDVNSRATRAKSEVIGYWNAIASEYGLSSRDSGSI